MSKKKKNRRRIKWSDILVVSFLLLVIVVSAVVVYRRLVAESPALGAARAGGDYLLRHLDARGQFDYLYNPLTDKVAAVYNILRHAGTTYSLLELYEATGKKKYLAGGERALQYLVGYIKPCGVARQALCVVDEDDDVKLGGNGLAILALAKYNEVTGSDIYNDEAKKLADWILSVQTASGEFAVHKMSAAGIPAPGFVSGYYPGEAVFGLTRLYEATGEDKYLAAARQGARWLIEVRDRGLAESELAHDHWLLYGLNELYDYDPNPLYVAHTEKIVNSIERLQHQNLTGERWFWNGGYYNPPRSTPTATRSEGLAAAYRLFQKSGRTDRLTDTYDALERGIAFELSTQITKNKVRILDLPARAQGGFGESLTELSVRIDYVQHNISALLAFERINRKSYSRAF